MTADDLFTQALAIATADDQTPGLNRMMHETLVLACHEAIKDTNQAFGNLFAQVDYLCKHCRVSVADTIAIQTMRRHSNSSEPLSREDRLYDVRALCLFISAVFSTGIPSSLLRVIPKENRPFERAAHTDFSCIRCIVESVEGDTLTVIPEQGMATEQAETLTVSIAAPHLSYIKDIVGKGTQLNLIDCATLPAASTNTQHPSPVIYSPSLIILEPDFLVDISPISRTFQQYGRHPLIYTINRLSPSAVSQPILLGNLAGSVLDDVIHSHGNYDVRETIRNHFRDKAIEFCTCKDFNRDSFIADAYTQAQNIQDAVSTLAGEFSLDKAILEPSFVCERLGISGRFDLLTSDFRLLIEQKSGKNFNIQIQRPGEHGSMMQEEHYVQLLLYYGILRYNFNLGFDRVSLRLLYSKYPAKNGLIVVNYLQQLFREAIRVRNLIVAWDLHIANHGFESIIDLITPATVNERNDNSTFFTRWKLPELKAVCDPLHRLSPLERAYFCRMLTFVYQEQRVALLGSQEGITHSTSDLWNMPLQEKIETGSIIMGAHLSIQKENQQSQKVYTFTLTHNTPLPHREGQGESLEDWDGSSPNFRRGDFIYLYTYREDQEPDVRHSILHKGNLNEIHTDYLVVELNEPQRLSADDTFAIEHASADSSSSASIRSLFQFIQADPGRKALLLGQREPACDPSVSLSRSWHPDYDEVLLRAMQARDYFLLIGPPGTGKTSMALHFIVEEELARGGTLLLMSYTNRAVDEICAMLQKASLPFLRIGNRASCEPAYRSHLLEEALGDRPQLSDIRQQLQQTRIVVGTTSMLQARPHIFGIKQFSLAVIDEASQILEPQLVGLLSRKTIARFILIGDHKQLPAVVQQNEKESRVDDPMLNAIQLDDCRHSLFERLIRTERKAGRRQFTGMLRKQGRMHPDIAEFPNRMFYNNQLDIVPLPHQLEAPTTPRVIFIPSEPCRQAGVSDKVNICEARIVARLLHDIYCEHANHFDAAKTVGVIVPYRNQIAMIRREVAQLGIPQLNAISIDTVERYQGSQRDVIVYSFTVQHAYQLDFLTANSFEESGCTIDRKLNVAMTRARKQLLMTGCASVLSQNAVFAELISQFIVHS